MGVSTKYPLEVISAFINGTRPAHWIKNIFVFAALPFGGKIFSLNAWLMCGSLFLIFCGLASGIYLINDVRDREADSLHPRKRKRAVASGRLPVSLAIIGACLLISISLLLVFCVDRILDNGFPFLTFFGGSYILINLLYTFWLKSVALADVILISLGFVIRVIAGAVVIQVPASPWLIVCSFMLSLFMSITKRRSEIIDCPTEVAHHVRKTSAFYSPERLEHMLAVAASLAILSYSLYCISPETQERMGTLHLVWTIPLVVYGIFRYYCLSGMPEYGAPVEILLKDRVMWFTGIAWLSMVLLIIHFGKSPLLNAIFQ